MLPEGQKPHDTIPGVKELLQGLEDIDWSGLQDAYGSAEAMPPRLRRLLAPDEADRAETLRELWGTVWHQGTVYDCTPPAVTFLAEVVAAPEVDEATRAQVALLMASLAVATSFVPPENPIVMLPAAWLREPGDPVPAQDFAAASRTAVAGHAAALGRVFVGASRPLRTGLTAVFASLGSVPSAAVRDGLLAMEDDGDARLATAARVTRLLAEEPGSLTAAGLRRQASVDSQAADCLRDIEGWPVPMQAAELVGELTRSVLSTTLHRHRSAGRRPREPGEARSLMSRLRTLVRWGGAR